MEEIKFMNTKQVAQALGCSMPTARQIMMRADFPLIRVGKNYKVSEQAFVEWSKKRRVQQRDAAPNPAYYYVVLHGKSNKRWG